jgi:hypothetical protein
MALKIINALTKKQIQMNVKAYFRLWFFFRVWKLLFHDFGTCSKKLIWVFLPILFSSLVIGCSQKRGIANQPKQQFYQDITEGYLPSGKVSIQGATFARLDRNLGSDLVWFTSTAGKGTKIKILLNEGSKGIGLSKDANKVKRIAENIRYLANVDIDRNGTDDLVLITSSSKKGSAKVLFNNGKGYFYSKLEFELPFINSGIERVDPVDLDQDGDVDFLFTGSKVLNKNGKINRMQGQVLINNGRGQFKDQTYLLWPKLPLGLVSTAIADYDQDGFPDIFLVYGNAQNRLLINNGVGKFIDKTSWSLPKILDQSTHADWADFDFDGDNDLLVTNNAIAKPYQSYSDEKCYFLENIGSGRFIKKSNKILPVVPATRVYLLDANGTGIPDAIILTKKGLRYLVGKGKWSFISETQKRFPQTRPMREMSFGDINGDGFLDILGLVTKNNHPKLWLNRIN